MAVKSTCNVTLLLCSITIYHVLRAKRSGGKGGKGRGDLLYLVFRILTDHFHVMP